MCHTSFQNENLTNIWTLHTKQLCTQTQLQQSIFKEDFRKCNFSIKMLAHKRFGEVLSCCYPNRMPQVALPYQCIREWHSSQHGHNQQIFWHFTAGERMLSNSAAVCFSLKKKLQSVKCVYLQAHWFTISVQMKLVVFLFRFNQPFNSADRAGLFKVISEEIVGSGTL